MTVRVTQGRAPAGSAGPRPDVLADLARVEDEVSAVLAAAALVSPHRAARLLALADEARANAAAIRARQAEPASAAAVGGGAGGAGPAELADRLADLRRRRDELREARTALPARLTDAQVRQRAADEQLTKMRLRYVQALLASAQAHERAADVHERALAAGLSGRDHRQLVREHRAAAAADRGRAEEVRAAAR